ncbi:MAG: Coenzyme F420 hydrogenase/dehydrogenase, beta subunit C-terminal domain [Candidatus Electrothrix scaldis]|nr:MAG: Coenzyme F420 hydrogenase/dehydrogenase, beta subunit C-terminal domain [Candidatus Electrothrix sp. GW3-3]
MIKEKTITIKKYKKLCTACGICVAACPGDALEMRLSSAGIMRPILKANNQCRNCGLCIKVCGGYKLPDDNDAVNCPNRNSAIGPWHKIYIGYAQEKTVRARGASGGVVTSLLIHLLKRGDIRGAIVTVTDPENPFSSKTTLATSQQELLASQKSRYTQVDFSQGLKELLQAPPGNYAIVGLPCHLASLEKLTQINRRVRDKLFIRIGLFCGRGSSSHLGELVAIKGLKIIPKSVKNVCYRSGPWEKFGFEYQGDFGKKWMQFGGNSIISQCWSTFFLCPRRCLLCNDGFAEYSDISCGDAWNIFTGNKELGGSVVIIRSQIGQQVVDKGSLEQSISLTEIKIEDLLLTQPSIVRFQEKLHPAIVKIFSLFHSPVPLNLREKSKSALQYKQLVAGVIIIFNSQCSLMFSRSGLLRYVPASVLSTFQKIFRKGIQFGSKK